MEQSSTDFVDSDLLVTAVVPLQVTAKSEDGEIVIWSNPRASSTRFCLPLRIQHIKENQEILN